MRAAGVNEGAKSTISFLIEIER